MVGDGIPAISIQLEVIARQSGVERERLFRPHAAVLRQVVAMMVDQHVPQRSLVEDEKLIAAVLSGGDDEDVDEVWDGQRLLVPNGLSFAVEGDVHKSGHIELPRPSRGCLDLHGERVAAAVGGDQVKVGDVTGERRHEQPAPGQFAGDQVFADLFGELVATARFYVTLPFAPCVAVHRLHQGSYDRFARALASRK